MVPPPREGNTVSNEYEPGPARPPEEVRESVKLPAIFLLINGALVVLMSVWGVVSSTIGRTAREQEISEALNRPDVPPAMRKFFEYSAHAGPVPGVISLILGGLIIFGAVKMLKVQSRTWAMVAAILSLIPCLLPCCCLGVPFGIWALVVLNKPEVVSAFRGEGSP
jgi:hypothetical protein